MTPISQYAEQNDKLRLILQGSSGSGKTTVACQFPGAYVIDIDVNLGGTLRFLKEAKLPLPIGFDVLDHDEKGAVVPLKQQFLRLQALVTDAIKDDRVQTIIFDSATTLADVLIGEVCRQQGKNAVTDWKDGRQFWGFFAPFCRNFFAFLSQVRKHIVLIAHEKTQLTETGAVVYPIKVAWPGQVGQNIGAFFTNVWRTEVQILPAGVNQNNYKWLIRTMPEPKYELKNTLGLPATFEFKWATIQAALDKGKEVK